MVTFDITRDMLQYYDASRGQWTLEPGDFVLRLGTASDNLPISLKFKAQT